MRTLRLRKFRQNPNRLLCLFLFAALFFLLSSCASQLQTPLQTPPEPPKAGFDCAAYAKEQAKWAYVGKERVKGLERRRAAETAPCENLINAQ